MLSQDPQDLQDHLDFQVDPVVQVLRETEDTLEQLVLLDLLVPPVHKVHQDSLERKETQVMPLQSVVLEGIKVTLASLDHLVYLDWMVDLVVMEHLELLDPKDFLVPCW